MIFYRALITEETRVPFNIVLLYLFKVMAVEKGSSCNVLVAQYFQIHSEISSVLFWGISIIAMEKISIYQINTNL